MPWLHPLRQPPRQALSHHADGAERGPSCVFAFLSHLCGCGGQGGSAWVGGWGRSVLELCMRERESPGEEALIHSPAAAELLLSARPLQPPSLRRPQPRAGHNRLRVCRTPSGRRHFACALGSLLTSYNSPRAQKGYFLFPFFFFF